jgi:hypothetical protein
VSYEHAIVAIVRDSVLLDNTSQAKYVGDGLLVIPYISVITSHIALWLTVMEPPLLFSCISVLDLKILFTRSRLLLVEQLGVAWFKLAFHLCKFGSVTGDLEVRLPLGGVRLRDVGIFFWSLWVAQTLSFSSSLPFLTLFAWLEHDFVSSSTLPFGQCVAGCPTFPHLKHVVSFQYSLSQEFTRSEVVSLPWIYCFSLFLPSVRIMTLPTGSPWIQWTYCVNSVAVG